MPKYVALVNWTQQGVSAVADTTKRAQQARDMAASMGVRFDAQLWTMGRYDLVCVIDAPDDETASAFVLRVVGFGALRVETLRAFEADEMNAILGRLG